MSSLAEFNSGAIKCLNVGKPGAGKTGAMISILIADPEARLFVCNFDRGNFGTLAGVARFDPKTGAARDPALVDRLLTKQIFYHNFQDKIDMVNGIIMVTGTPTAFTGVGKKLRDWGPPFEPGKGINECGPKDWLMFDSISAMGDAAMRYSLSQSGRLGKRPEQSDWGDAINRLSMFLEMFNDPELPFNIMATTHVRFVGDMETQGADGKAKEVDMVPNALGQKLPQEIGRYFNNIIETRVVGDGPGSRRLIHTRSPGGLVLRSSNPGAVKPTYDVYDGMAQWVKDLRSTPSPVAPATQPASTQPA
jgi:hypothetical protein